MFAFWRRIPGFWQNFIAGLLIIGALLSMDRLQVVKDWEDWAVDTMIRLNVKLARMTGTVHGRTDLEFTFLDMDEFSFRDKAWNEPYHVPRDKVLKLIRFAVAGKASLIFVDVDFSKKGTDPEADKALIDYIRSYPRTAPPLILLRAKRMPEGSDALTLGEFRETIFGDIDKPNIHYAQPLFRRDKKDGVIRNWLLFDQGCYKGRGVALPSVQLLAYALLKDRQAGGGRRYLDDLYASMNINRPVGCETGRRTRLVQRPVVLGKTIFKQQRLGERLIYSIPWPKSGGDSPDLIEIHAVFITDRNYKNYEDVAGRITLIGASYGASHDLHHTPLGLMPGSLIILNAIKSLSLFDQITPPPLYIRLAFLLGFITILSYVFSKYSNFIKLLIVSTLVFIFFVPISFWLFKYGVWFDFGILLLGIKLQHSASEFFEVRELKRLRSRMEEIERSHEAGLNGLQGQGEDRQSEHQPVPEEVRVRLQRHDDGSLTVKAAPRHGPEQEFTIEPRGLVKSERGFRLELTAGKPSQ